MDKKITDSIIYIGVDDKDIDLFESQYVVPNGVSYNSYRVSVWLLYPVKLPYSVLEDNRVRSDYRHPV